jgi:hypothetical protein
MSFYYRSLVLNVVVMVAFTASMLLHGFGKAALLAVQLALLVANCAIARSVAFQLESPSQEKHKWGFGLWWAWTSGPSTSGLLPLMVAFLFIKTDFLGILNLVLMAYFAYSSWTMVNDSELGRANNWGSPN